MAPRVSLTAIVFMGLAACGGERSAGGGGSGGAGGESGAGGASGDSGVPADAGPDATTPRLACLSPPPLDPPACGSATPIETLLPGPGSTGHDAMLEAKALQFERQFHALNGHGVTVNADLGVDPSRTAERALIAAFVASDEWDFAAQSGSSVMDVVDSFRKVAGAYAGAGVAADAFRYVALRDQGADCAEIDRARGFLAADLEALHLAVAVTGVEGVIARGYAKKTLPGDGEVATTPIFDANGNPQPEPKTNGTWREDNSGGDYPDTIWEDSCSRDMFVGWVLGFGAAWEAIWNDPSFDETVKARMRADAAALARSLMKVGADGYDLEILDADGRRTYHGILHESSIDRLYLPNAMNGFNAMLAVGIVGTLAWISGDSEIDTWLRETLLDARSLHVLARDNLALVDLGVLSNFSGYHMAFQGGFLASRYLCHDDARSVVREAIHTSLYERPGSPRQPSEQKQTFYDVVHAAALAGGTPWTEPDGDVDQAALDRGVETLLEYPAPPFFTEARENCDVAEIAALACVGLDGTAIEVLSQRGRGDVVVAAAPVPMRIRPHSNWYWRSNPYEVNGGNTGGLLAGNDFRVAYWIARSLPRPTR